MREDKDSEESVLKKIAIFGGSFNPIHSGHIHLIRSFDEQIGFDEMILVPSARPPHKDGDELAFGEDRFFLCSLVAEEDVRYRVSRFELSRPEISYTIDTVDVYKRQARYRFGGYQSRAIWVQSKRTYRCV